MADIDFIKQKNKVNPGKDGKVHYGVEYTNPTKEHRSLKQWWQSLSNKKKHSSTTVPTAPQSSVRTAALRARSKPVVQANNKVTSVMPVQSQFKQSSTTATNNSKAVTTSPVLAPALNALNQSKVITQPVISVNPVQSASTVSAQSAVKMAPILPTSPDQTVLLTVKQSVPQVKSGQLSTTTMSKPVVTALRVIPTPPTPPSHTMPAVPAVSAIQQPPVKLSPPVAPVMPIVKPASQVVPVVPTVPLQGLPTAPAIKTVVSPLASPQPKDKPIQPTKTVVLPAGDIQAHNVSQYTGVTTNPNPPAAGVLHINLLPQLSTALTPVFGKIQQLLNTILGSLIVVGVIYLGVLGYQTYYFIRTDTNLTVIAGLDQAIIGYQSLQDQVNATAKQLSTISTLLQQHRYWTNVFLVLEQYTLPNVYYSLVNADANGAVTLQAVTTDYASVSHQIAVFKQANRYINQVQVATASGADISASNGNSNNAISTTSSTGLITFNITLQLNPEVLNYHYAGYFQD